MKCNKSGFTLIELLVVVLIIGILAAVAIPQYQKAVEKSKFAYAKSILKSADEVQRAYYLANGEYADTLTKLDIDLPWTGTTRAPGLSGGNVAGIRSNEEWSIEFYLNSTTFKPTRLRISRMTGPYQGCGWIRLYEYEADQILCTEPTSLFQTEGDCCKKLFNGTRKHGIDTHRYFTTPS